MNRRIFLTNTLFVSASVLFFNANQPTVVSYKLIPNKHQEYGTGEGDSYRILNSYNSNTLEITLSNGNKVENWIDDENKLNSSWKHWDRFNNMEEVEADFTAAESFSSNYFGVI